MKIDRRNFLQSAAVLTSGVFLSGTNKASGTPTSISNLIKIEEPFNGAVLNRNHGIVVSNGLKIKVQGEAPLYSNVTVNGKAAVRSGTKFISEVILNDKETDIIAKADGWFGTNSHNIRVVWDKNSFLRYGFEIDDNIFFLRDIARNKYRSIFDSFYLRGLKELHKKYGTKVVLNTYYTDGLEYSNKKKEFLLSQFPDRYKSEWQDNSDWLRLTFHAYSNSPARPYQYASPNKLIEDMDKVASEIRRFAGDQTFTLPTIVHWGMILPSAYKPLADRGVKVLRGYFRKGATGGWDVNHNVDEVRSEYLSRHDALKDFDSGITFAKVDMVINGTPTNKIVPILNELKKDPNKAEIIDLMTHEQHFWPFYSSHVPDHFERLDIAFRWVTDNGYKPVFFHEGFLGA